MPRLFFVLALLLPCVTYGQDATITPFSIGEAVEIYSELLEEKRTLNIYLPASFHPDSNQTYAVIYLLDGSREEDFVHIAGLVQFATFPWIKMIPETIVVGMANVDRKRDFTYPTRLTEEKEAYPSSGGAVDFIAFIEKEVQPFIRKRYRTEGERTLIGQSLGGLLATTVLYEKPDLFDNYIIVSPSLWWDEESLLGRPWGSITSPKRVYVAVGEEGPIMKRLAETLYKQVEEVKTEAVRTRFHFLAEQDHGDALHLAVYDALDQLFRERK